MYDELVKQLREPVHSLDCEFCDRICCYPEGKSESKCVIIQAADAIERLADENTRLVTTANELSKMYDKLVDDMPDGWIPVTERLPDAEPGDASERVLVTDGKDVAIVEWFNFEECGPFWGYTGFGNDVTHWMPLPEPPKEETE